MWDPKTRMIAGDENVYSMQFLRLFESFKIYMPHHRPPCLLHLAHLPIGNVCLINLSAAVLPLNHH